MAVSQEDIVRKVQALWAQADHPNTSTEERVVFVGKAKELMAKHAIDELVLSKATATHEEVVIADFLIFEEDEREAAIVPDERMMLAHYITMYNRCKGIMTWKDASVYADGSAQLAGRYMLVFGFRSDVHLVELLYANLMADMIVQFYRTDLRHVKRKKDRENIMRNFCKGYADRIGQRLAEVNREVHRQVESDGSLLPVLRNREAAVVDKFDEMFPPDERTSVSVQGYVDDPNAQAAGAAAAEEASLGGRGVGGGRKGALEA